MLLFCAVALPWYALVQIRNQQFFHEFIVEHNLARFGTNLYHHPEPFWYYVPVTLLGWMPWSIVAIASLVWAIRRFLKPNTDALHSFLVIWTAVIVFFFSISNSKLPGYVLPAIPSGAILAVEFLRLRMAGERVARLKRTIVAGLHASAVAGLLFCAVVVRYLVLQHRVPWHAAGIPLMAAGVVAVVIFVMLVKSDLRLLRTVTLIPAIVTVAFALRFGSQPLDETLSARPVANQLADFDPHHLPVAVFLAPRETEFGLAFYRNQIVSRYELGQVPAGEHLVVAAQGYPKGVEKVAGRKITYLGKFAPQRLEFFYVGSK
jgi:4-amino-4-deoxy-L-arabinose transferase-like glycosyltransferase